MTPLKAELRTCILCGESFYTLKVSGPRAQKFCSPQCRNRASQAVRRERVRRILEAAKKAGIGE